LPFEQWQVAPYIYGGFGRQWQHVGQWTGHIGGGVEWRATPEMGVFFDVRQVAADKTRDFTLYRLGVRFGF
ncbi:MAG: hypothetical protein ACK4UN_14540, partial [Limisphaerales bacterium]